MIKTEMAHKKEELSEINITPFIDIMLVLLIVFMAVTPLITSSIKIELPKSSQQAEDKLKNPIILYLNTDNTLAINDDKLSLENLSSALDIKTKGNKEEIIYFHIDKSVKYEDIMQVMQKLKENGYGKIALSSKKMD
ncbi:biopolymer transporter ExbD [Campylobacter jejuni]|nr:biopolymer transporter ExbD [Campylobacter jejuni]ELG2314341.1 biopolymer transporter ExbD [Campylobacter jejuni]